MAKKAKKMPQYGILNKKKKIEDLYSIFDKESGRQIYGGNGVPQEEAQRLFNGLALKDDYELIKVKEGAEV